MWAEPARRQSGYNRRHDDPEADYYTIPETAHFLMMEKPIEFNRMLLKFVEKFK